MKLDTLNRLYSRELDEFHGAVGRLQMDLARLASTPCPPDHQPGLEQYLEKMRDLGSHLERIFALVNEKYWGSIRLNTQEVHNEIQSLRALHSSNAPADCRAGSGVVPPCR